VGTIRVTGTKVRGHDNTVRPCERCGREVRRWNRRDDGLIICKNCTSDKWWIAKVTAKV
jgi:formylmethanofuran dehydrogenase subunit E